MSSPRQAAVTALAALALLAGGCGSDEGVAPPDPPARAPGPCVARQPAPGELVLGVHAALIHERPGPNRDVQARLACRTGATVLREDLSWRDVEPRPGLRRWRRADAIVAVAARHGLTVLPVLGTTPGWAGPRPDTTPRDTAAFARFAVDVARRYGPGGAFWTSRPRLPRREQGWIEIYNEIYIANPNPQPYGRLVAATAAALRGAGSKVRLLVDAEACVPSSAGTRLDWLSGLFDADPQLARDAGALSVHPYGDLDASDRCRSPQRIEDLRAQLVARGAGNLPLWITEIGWPTCTGRPASCVSEAEQARRLRRFLGLVRTRWSSYVPAVIVFRLRDYGPRSAADPEPWFGLLRPRTSRKPAWSAFRGAATAASAKAAEASR
jgi:hypothetical protein